tara:strand:- start:13314 stop:14705 length:1392 start_codon:yes stop_codon:yes gene_type:complete
VNNKTQVVTRFAPSPTGYLHIGGVRTALFNWLYAKKNNGKFLLRIEDTDRKRSSKEAINIILEGLEWLGLNFDDTPIYQNNNIKRHREIVQKLLNNGNAYKCWASEEELTLMKNKAKKDGSNIGYNGLWRDKEPTENEEGKPYTVRFKSEQSGETIVNDNVQGNVIFQNNNIEDFIILRSDGSPTYMLSAVVDDHDMMITDIIRGDDHLNNTAKQIQLYKALNWKVPKFSHIPLIHGDDGSKLSKRHGALGIDYYEKKGFLSEAIKNYLLRLGWSHGDKEIFSETEMIELFNLKNIRKSSSRLDIEKLKNLNNHYIKSKSDDELFRIIKLKNKKFEKYQTPILKILSEIKIKTKTIDEIIESLEFISQKRPIKLNTKAIEVLTIDAKNNLSEIKKNIETLDSWDVNNIEQMLKGFSSSKGIKFKDIGLPLRAVLTGTLSSPSIYNVLDCLGKDEVLHRIDDAL